MIGLNGSNLIGLPTEFQPAKLDLENGILSIAEKKLVFAPFLRNIFVETARSDIRISSSWYHDTKIMPPYIDLRMTPKGRGFSYHVLVDMKNLVILEVELELQISDIDTQSVPIDPRCWKDGVGGGSVRVIQ